MRAVDELAGTIIAERYTVRQLVGQGGIGKVYKVTDGRLERPGALKVLLPRLAKRPDFAQLLEHEAKITARLRHPNIVSIYDRGKFDGLSYIVSEYVEGCSLKEVLAARKSPLRLAETVAIAAAVGRALAFAHRARVVHRDIKPSNILLSETGDVLLTDFGLATVAGHSSLDDAGAIIGTPEYMSPEQASGAQVDFRSDIYSLAIILYECLEGERPFTPAKNGTKVSRDIAGVKLTWQTLPPGIEPVLLRALNQDRNQRFDSVQDFASAFAEAAGGQNGSSLARLVSDAGPPGAPAETQVFAPEEVHPELPVPAMYAITIHSGKTSPDAALPRVPEPPVREALVAEPESRQRGTPAVLIETPDGLTREIPLTVEKLTLGRSSTCELSFPDDAGLSRQHLSFEKVGDRWAVRDLGSKNGTLVNGVRVTGAFTLNPGDRVSAGHVVIQFGSASAPAEPGVVFDDKAVEGSSSVVENLARSQQALARIPGSAAEQIQALIRAGREITADRPLTELFRLMLDLSIEAVDAQRGVLLTLEGEELTVRAARGTGFRISSAVRDRVLQDAASILVSDAQVDEAYRDEQSIIAQHVRSMIAVPLQVRDRIIGLIYVDSPDIEHPFTREDLNLLTVMANVAANRIEQARLAEVEGAERAMASELLQAAQIQQELIPARAPEVAGFDVFGAVSRCRTVGGDYFDFLPHADGRMTVALGDVSGKGLPAALLMTSLQARVRILFEQPGELAQRVARLNFAEASSIPSNRFITFFICVLDPESGHIRYVNAGHNPPLVIRANGSPPEALPAGGVILGIIPGFEYREVACTLDRGDILVVYSDGVTEALGLNEEEFGETRLAEVVAHNQQASAQLIAQTIVSTVHEFMAGQPLTDDLTVVVIKRTASI